MSEHHWKKAIIHADMDAFFAAVEQHDNPELRGKPVIIGGSPDSRGVVSTASYEARKYGVHSAMPCFKAKSLCPSGIFLPGRMKRYQEVSRVIHNIFSNYTPQILPISCDEAFLDVTGSVRLLGTPEIIAKKIKAEVKETTGLTISIGLSTTMFVAKIASDMQKPDGLTVIYEDEVIEKLAPLPVSRMWGVGKVAAKNLLRQGIQTIGQLQQWELNDLINNFGNFGEQLYLLCRGIDNREVEGSEEAEKSISNETTFRSDVLDIKELEKALLWLADKVATRTRAAELSATTVQLKVKYSDFKSITRRQTLPCHTSCAQEIYTIVRKLLKEKTECGVRPVRLVGVGVSGFNESEQVQSSLFTADNTEVSRKMKQAEIATDKITDKLGPGLIGRGAIILHDKE